MLTAVEVEQRIWALSSEMEEMTYDLAERAEAAAEAEAHYKAERAKSRLSARSRPGHGPSGRTTDAEADDVARKENEAALRDYLVKDAIYQATRDALYAKRTQIEALRTIAASIRSQT